MKDLALTIVFGLFASSLFPQVQFKELNTEKIIPVFDSTPHPYRNVVLTTSECYLYGTPTFNSPLKTLPKHAKLLILEPPADWLKVREPEGRVGYINTMSITPYEPYYKEDSIQQAISKEKSQNLIQQNPYVVTSRSSLYKDVAKYDEYFKIEQGTVIEILEVDGQFYYIVVNNQRGYVHSNWVKPLEFAFERNLPLFVNSDSLKTIITKRSQDFERIKEQANLAKHEEEARRKTNDSVRLAKLIKKYGVSAGDKIAKGHIWIGMTKEMLVDSMGQPKDKNISVGTWGTHEQWVYSSVYVYIENGKVTSYQY